MNVYWLHYVKVSFSSVALNPGPLLPPLKYRIKNNVIQDIYFFINQKIIFFIINRMERLHSFSIYTASLPDSFKKWIWRFLKILLYMKKNLSPWFTWEFTVYVVHSMGFDKRIMTFIYFYNMAQKNSFTALNILYASPVHASPVHPSLPPPNPWQPLIFLLSP